MIAPEYITAADTDYEYSAQLQADLLDLRQRVELMRDKLNGPLGSDATLNLREQFRILNIYHSNAIEGSKLTIGETRLVVEEGLTITGKPLEDSLSARNLAHALDFFELLAQRNGEPIRAVDIRSIHEAVLKDIDDYNAWKYKTTNVLISGSKYEPPDAGRVPGEMQQFTDWLQKITTPGYEAAIDPLTLACTAHAWFVRIHPFIDGNGRTARLIMNLILIRRGYPLTIITKDSRLRYYEALEESQASDLTPFLRLVYEAADESMTNYERLAAEPEKNSAFAEELRQKIHDRETNRQTAEFEIYQSAMSLLKAAFRQVTETVNQADSPETVQLWLKDFGTLDFEKFQQLQRTRAAERSWFFRITITVGNKTTRYIFFFGYASAAFVKNRPASAYGVTLHIAFETEKYFYERLATLSRDDLPDLFEISYDPQSEQFIALKKSGTLQTSRAEELAREFIRQAT